MRFEEERERRFIAEEHARKLDRAYKDGGDWEIDYTTPVTDDVVGYVDDLDLVLGEIYDLPEDLELEE